MRPTTRRTQQHSSVWARQPLFTQPCQRRTGIGPTQGVDQATAADGGQQCIRRGGSKNEAGVGWRLFQGFEQSMGCDGVHLLGRVNHHHFAALARARQMAKLQHFAQRLHPNLAAGLTLFVINLFLRLFAQRPCSFNHFGLGHQHPEVGMYPHSYAVTTGALTASALRRGGLAQPALCQSQGQVILPQTRGALDQPRVPWTGEQVFQGSL